MNTVNLPPGDFTKEAVALLRKIREQTVTGDYAAEAARHVLAKLRAHEDSLLSVREALETIAVNAATMGREPNSDVWGHCETVARRALAALNGEG